MITPETAAKLKELAFPLVSVGREDHEYAAEFCRFCGFPFLKIGDTYYLLPVINAIIPAIGTAFESLGAVFDTEHRLEQWKATSCTFSSVEANNTVTKHYSRAHAEAAEADEALCLLWIGLRERNELP